MGLGMSKRVILILEDIFGEEYSIEGVILDKKTHGYNLKSGGWALYPDKNSEHAVFIKFKEKGKRKPIVINTNRIINKNVLERELKFLDIKGG